MAGTHLVLRRTSVTARNWPMLGSVSAMALAVCCSSAASAQTSTSAPTTGPAAAPAQNEGIADIIVTAQRREQKLQDVPIAVTAVSGNTLTANGIKTVVDLTGVVPGLYARPNAGGLASPSFALRGVQSASSSSSQDRETSIYLDGVYLGSSRGNIFDIPDTERIEVLRGPQGTLFGRNATAGAISVVTRNPTGKFGATQEFTYGNYNQFRTRTSIDFPAMGPFSAYATYVHDERDGDTRNTGAGTTFDRSTALAPGFGVSSSPKTLGGKNINEFFAAVRFEPSSDFKMTYKFDSTSGSQAQDVRTVTAINPNSFVGNLLEQVLAAQPAGGGAFGPVYVNSGDRRPDAYNNAWTQNGHIFAQGHSLTTEWQVTDHLSLKNITAFRRDQVYGPATVSGLSGLQFTQGAVLPYAVFAAASSVPGFAGLPPPFQGAIIGQFAAGLQPSVGQYFAAYEGNNYGRQHQFSSELQAFYTSSLMNLTVGALYFQAKEIGSGVPGEPANFAFQPVPTKIPLGGVVEDRASTKSYAAYAQADIHITDKFDLQVGGRVSHDNKQTSLTQGGVFTGGQITGATVISGVYTLTKPTYSVALNYRPVPGTLVYIKTSTAFLSGGAVGDVIFKPEYVRSYEAGVKADLFDRRLRVNVAIWDARYDGLQQAQAGTTVGHPNIGALAVNTGTVNARGVEAEITAQPIDGLTLGGNIGYTHDKLSNISPLLLLKQTRYELAGVPSVTGGVYAQLITKPVFDEATMLFRIDALYQGRYRSITDPDVATHIPAFAPYEFAPARVLLNARVALSHIPLGNRAKAELAAFGRNLTNNRDPSFPFPFSDILFTDAYQAARTYGLQLTLKY
jgi:iron complex outermembrane receptor protein